MRIIRGKYRGKSILPPKSFSARPTTDFAKEGIFNIIENNFDIELSSVLDLFAGTGGISYEFASRGCEDVTTVDLSNRYTLFMKKSLTGELKLLEPSIAVIKADAFRFIRNAGRKYTIVFADPPFDLENLDTLPDAVFSAALVKENGWLILEHSDKNNFAKHPNFVKVRKYGKINFSLFEPKEDQQSTP